MNVMAAFLDGLGGLFRPEIIWFLIGLGLLILEFLLPGLIVFFFGLGAMVTAVVCLVTEVSLNVQLLIFAGSSVVLLAVLRRLVKRVFAGDANASGPLGMSRTEYVGQRAVVTSKIEPHRPGKVEFHGTHWTAESEHVIEPGTPVEIVGQENLVLNVKPL